MANRASDAPWTPADEAATRKVKDLIYALQRVPCTSCGYCLPCPEGVDIPRNFTFCNDHHMLQDRSARMRYHNFLNDRQRASACVQCGSCEERCPQQIPIREELAHVVEIFENQ
jgi:predicted aldo/keto reductase-like oxidoreductase